MDTLLHRTPSRSSSSLWMNVTKKPKQASWVISVWAFSLHSEQSVFRTAPALKCVLNNKVSTSLTLSRTEGIAVERIQHLNIEFRTEVKKERYRLNLSLSSRLRASNQNLYEVFQIRPVKQTLLFGIKKRGWCYIVEDTCKAGAFRIHLVQYVSKSQTGTTHGNCSGSYVTYFQRDEVERAGARGNSRTGLATIL